MTAVTPDPYVCSICYVVFPGASLLADHMTTHEAVPIDSDSVAITAISAITPITIPPNLLNDDSGSENGDEDGILIEGYAHPNGRDYLCTICNKLFKRKDYFKQHMLSHSKKFKCPHCAFNFARKDHLNRHLKNRVCLRGLEEGEGGITPSIVGGDGGADFEDDDDDDDGDDVIEEAVVKFVNPVKGTGNVSGIAKETRPASSYFSTSRRSKRGLESD